MQHHPAVDDVRLGIRFRVLRHRLGWRQRDLAARADVSQGLVSLVERGRVDAISLGKLKRLARELDAELFPHLRWRGGDLDRLVDEAHADLVGRGVAILRSTGWDCRVEVSYSIFGERGSIDVLAWHATARVVLVIEVKTELVSIEETLRKHDAKVRLASRVVSEQFDWRPNAVARLLVLPSLATARRRASRHGVVLASTYPMRGRELRAWIVSPSGSAAGLLFVGSGENGRDRKLAIGRKRIRKTR